METGIMTARKSRAEDRRDAAGLTINPTAPAIYQKLSTSSTSAPKKSTASLQQLALYGGGAIALLIALSFIGGRK